MQRPLYLFFILLLTSLPFLTAWIPAFPKRVSLSSSRIYSSSEEWKGAVVSNAANGKINGCLITAVGEDPVTEWVIEIDGCVVG